jgi:hypothetical protein
MGFGVGLSREGATRTISRSVHNRFDNNRGINPGNMNILSRQHLGSHKNTNIHSHVDIWQTGRDICSSL